MGFKKIISLACDGPCGTVLKDKDSAPFGWGRVTVQERAIKKHAKFMWLCPKCLMHFNLLINSQFAWNHAAEGKEPLAMTGE